MSSQVAVDVAGGNKCDGKWLCDVMEDEKWLSWKMKSESWKVCYVVCGIAGLGAYRN
jgi:hypothetical protein